MKIKRAGFLTVDKYCGISTSFQFPVFGWNLFYCKTCKYDKWWQFMWLFMNRLIMNNHSREESFFWLYFRTVKLHNSELFFFVVLVITSTYGTSIYPMFLILGLNTIFWLVIKDTWQETANPIGSCLPDDGMQLVQKYIWSIFHGPVILTAYIYILYTVIKII